MLIVSFDGNSVMLVHHHRPDGSGRSESIPQVKGVEWVRRHTEAPPTTRQSASSQNRSATTPPLRLQESSATIITYARNDSPTPKASWDPLPRRMILAT